MKRAAALCLGVLATGAAGGELFPPAQVGAGIFGPESVRMAVDSASNACLVFQGRDDPEAPTRIFCGFSLDEFATLRTFAVEKSDCRNPSVGLGPLGAVHILFQARSTAGEFLYYVTNKGGPFQAPQRLTRAGGVAERNGSVWVEASGGVKAVWEEFDGAASRVLCAVKGGAAAALAENATRPRAYLSPWSARLHVLFLRDGSLYYLREGSEPTLVAAGIGEDGGYDLITTAAGDVPHVVLTTPAGVWHAKGSAGAFDVPALLASGAVSPCLCGLPDGALACVYVAGGDVRRRVDRGRGFEAEEDLGATPAAETEAVCACDGAGFFHLAAAAGGALWYRNDIPPPAADFTCDPTAGEAPLAVQFTDESTGVIRSRLWEFGDGGTSAERNPVHVYAAPGKWTVTLAVAGPGGAARVARADVIEVAAPRNRFLLPSIKVWPGQNPVRHPVLAEHHDPVQGAQVAVAFRDDYLTGLRVTLAGTRLEALQPEFTAESVTDGAGGEKHLVFGVIIDVDPPFDGRMLPAAPAARTLLFLEYGVAAGAPLDTRIPVELRDGIGRPPIDNVLTVAGAASVRPALAGGSATTAPPPACPFRRGDANFDGVVNVADAIFVLVYLFAHASAPSCLDAADANDSGVVDIADVIYVLAYLFGSGAMPAYPFPDEGIDPTADGLPQCLCPAR